MFTVWWPEGWIFKENHTRQQVLNVLCRYQSRKRRPFSRYTARADKVRREKSFATGSGVNFEEQLTDIRGNLVNIQTENNLLKRDIDVVKGKYP